VGSQSLEVALERCPWPGPALPGATPNKDGCYASPLTFEFYRFRFYFRSAGTLFFPVYKSGNIVRGAFGDIFRKLVCIPRCLDAKTCDIRAECRYARVFEPQAARSRSTPRAKSCNFSNAIVNFAVSRIFSGSSTLATVFSTVLERLKPTVSHSAFT